MYAHASWRSRLCPRASLRHDPRRRLMSILRAYVPKIVATHLGRCPRPFQPAEQSFDAAVMLADLSGFTKLAERLEREVSAAAEELTRILNAFFGPLIDTIEAHGGDVVKFAGDA